MRKLKRRILSMLMAVLMVLSLTSNVVRAQPKGEEGSNSIGDKAGQILADNFGTKNTDFINNNDTDGAYKEKEAIVMAYVEDTNDSANITSVFQAKRNSKGEFSESSVTLAGDKVIVKTTYEFETKGTSLNSLSSNAATTSKIAPKTAFKVQISRFVSKNLSTDELIKAVKAKYTNVIAVQPNYAVKARGEDGKYKQYQWALDNQGQNQGTAGKDINPEDAWAAAKSDEKVIAIIDTGIDYTHEDLKDKMWVNETGVLEGSCGYDFFSGDSDPLDDNGHGTHCAGIIAGNGTGVTGVAKNVKLMALKFLDSNGGGYDFDAISAFDYINRAIKSGVNVVAINCSWGGGEGSDIFERLVNLVGQKGAITVTAAGNGSSNNDTVPSDPWAFSSDYMISVAASTEKGELACFSNYGENNVDIAAPGTDILSSVSYDAYNPTIHSGADQANYSEIYNDFSDTELPVGHKEFGIDAETMQLATAPSLTFDKNDSFGLGNDTSGSVSLEVKSDKDSYFGCFWPITLPESTTDYYLSAMVKDNLVSSGEDYSGNEVYYGVAPASQLEKLYKGEDIEQILYDLRLVDMHFSTPNGNYWSMVKGNTNIKKAEDGQYVFFMIGISYGKSTSEINTDNVGFSKHDMDSTAFGKYDFYSGTSMAAPHVTGSVALLRQCYPELSVAALRNKVAACGRSEEKLAGLVRDARNLDLSNYNKNVLSIKSTSYKDGKITLYGTGLSEVKSVSVDGNLATIADKKDSELSFTASNCVNKKVRLDITFNDDTTASKTEYISYNTVEVSEIASIEDMQQGSIVTDGSSMYCYGGYNFGAFNVAGNLQEWMYYSNVTNKVVDPEVIEEKGEEAAVIKTNIFYDNHKIYTLAQSDISYATSTAIVFFDTMSNEWSKLCDLPIDIKVSNIVGSSLAVYNGKIYLMGGMNKDTLEALSTVYTYDMARKMWLREADLPEPRAFAKANVAKGRLILTFGTVDGKSSLSNTAPAPLLLTNQEWSKSTAECKASANKVVKLGNKQYSYYDISVGASSKGLVFVGLVSDNYGDVFNYNVDNDSYEAIENCSLYPYTKASGYYGGTSVADQFCFFGQGEKKLQYDDWGDPYYTYSNKLYSIPMEAGYYKVAGYPDFCMYTGTGYYLPGESAEITIMPIDGYSVTGYLLNGVQYEGTTVTINKVDQDYVIEPIGLPYATGLEFDQKEYEVIAGESLTIYAQLLPYEAQDKISWYVDSDDSTVTDGILKTSLSDAGRELTVTASTESGVMNTCKVTVISTVQRIVLNREKLVLQQGDFFNIVATVTPSDPVNGLLRFKSSNPSVAMVNDSGDLVGLKPGKAVITISTIEKKNVKTVKVQCQVTVVAPINKVTKLKASTASDNIKLSWSKVTSADGYVVYRYDSKSKKNIQIAVINGGSNTSYTVSRLLGSKGDKLTAGTAYIFKVMAFDKVEGVVLNGPKASISTYTTPNASSIKGLKNSKKGEIKVTWTKAKGVMGYQIFVSKEANGKYKLKATIKKAGTYSATLKKFKTGTWYVKVRTYKVINGITIYSSLSKYKKIKNVK